MLAVHGVGADIRWRLSRLSLWSSPTRGQFAGPQALGRGNGVDIGRSGPAGLRRTAPHCSFFNTSRARMVKMNVVKIAGLQVRGVRTTGHSSYEIATYIANVWPRKKGRNSSRRFFRKAMVSCKCRIVPLVVWLHTPAITTTTPTLGHRTFVPVGADKGRQSPTETRRCGEHPLSLRSTRASERCTWAARIVHVLLCPALGVRPEGWSSVRAPCGRGASPRVSCQPGGQMSKFTMSRSGPLVKVNVLE